MRERILSALRFLNLLSFDDSLSWTNIALVGCVVKFWTAPIANYADLAAVLVMVGNYALKRQTNMAAETKAPTISVIDNAPYLPIDELEALQTEMAKIKTALGIRGYSFGGDAEKKK